MEQSHLKTNRHDDVITSTVGIRPNRTNTNQCDTVMALTDERWYFTKEQLANSPSRRSGIEPEKELSHRQAAANFIQDMGQRLQVTQLCINTAIVYMHRFYCFHSFSFFHRTAIAAAALFLAAKVEEQPRKLEHIIKVSQLCLQKSQTSSNPNPRLDIPYADQAQELVSNENVLLMTLGFDVAIEHPHAFIVNFCHLSNANKDLAQTSYFMASQCLHLTTMCLQYKPTIVACFCIHLTCKWSNYQIPASRENLPWYRYIDPTVTEEQLEQMTTEFLVIFDKCPSRLRKKIQNAQLNTQNSSMGSGYALDADSRKQFAADLQQASLMNGQKEGPPTGSSKSASVVDGTKKSLSSHAGSHLPTKPAVGDRVNGTSTHDPHRVITGHPLSTSKLPNAAVKPNVSGAYMMQPAMSHTHSSHKSGGSAGTSKPRALPVNHTASVKVAPSKPEVKIEPSARDAAIAHFPPSTVPVDHNHHQLLQHHHHHHHHQQQQQQQQPQQPAKTFKKDIGLGFDVATSGRSTTSTAATMPSSYSSHLDIISNVVKEVAKQPAKSHSIFSPNPLDDRQKGLEISRNTMANDFESVAVKNNYDESFRRPTTVVAPMNDHLGHRKVAPTMTVPNVLSLQTTSLLSNSMTTSVKNEPADTYNQPTAAMSLSVDCQQQHMALKAEPNDNAQQHAHKKKKKHKEKDKRHDKEKHHHKDKKRHKEEKHKHRKEKSDDRETARDPSPIKITIPKEKLTDIPKLTIRIKPEKITAAIPAGTSVAAATMTTTTAIPDYFGTNSETADRLKLKLSKDKLKSSRKRNRESDSEEFGKKMTYDPSASSSSLLAAAAASHNGYKC